jgi:hypothetical protein
MLSRYRLLQLELDLTWDVGSSSMTCARRTAGGLLSPPALAEHIRERPREVNRQSSNFPTRIGETLRRAVQLPTHRS